MSKILAFINQKGGVGKTTLLLNIAVYLSSIEKTVFVIDTDPQCSSTNFLENRDEKTKENSIVYCSSQIKGVSNLIKKIQNEYDYILIDTPGAASNEIMLFASFVDFIIIPMGSSWVDFDSTLPLITFLKENHLGSKYSIVINNMLPINYKETQNTIIELKEAGMNVCNSYICNRKIYKDSMYEFSGIIEKKSNNHYIMNAQNELTNLIKELNL